MTILQLKYQAGPNVVGTDSIYNVALKDTNTFVKDVAGNKAVTFGAIASTNNYDLVAPTATLPATTGTTNNVTALVATFNDGLSVAGTPVVNGADVSAAFTPAGGTLAITSAIYNANAKTVTFTLANALDTNTITHNTGVTALTDAAGNPYAAKVYTYGASATKWTSN